MREGFFTIVGLAMIPLVVFIPEHPRWQILLMGVAAGCALTAIHLRSLDVFLSGVGKDIVRWQALITQSQPRKRKGCKPVVYAQYLRKEKKA